MNTSVKYLFALGVPAALIAGAFAWAPTLMGPAGKGVVFETSPVTRGEVARIVSTSGPVRALVTVSVGSQLSGQISVLKADFNTEVKEGDVLAVLDDKTFRSRVVSARADLGAARSGLETQEANLVKAQAVLAQAERALARLSPLADKGIASQTALDAARRDKEVAEAEIAVVNAQLSSARAAIAQREAALRQAEIDLDRTVIRAPIKGTVISRTVDIGQTVAASLQAPELFKIAQDLRLIRIEAQVNEADIGAVAPGNAAQFTVDAYPERTFSGRVVQIRLSGVELQNVVTYTVIIEAENADRKLYPGMTANARIETAKRQDVLRVANDALRFKPKAGTVADEPGDERGEAGRGQRSERLVERLAGELQLTPEQAETLRTAAREAMAELRQSGSGPAETAPRPPTFGAPRPAPEATNDLRGNRGRMMERIERVLVPLLTPEQRPAFERWKQGRETTRMATLWVLDEAGVPQRRPVRLGLADDRYTEVVGRGLAEGDRVVTRAREARK